METQTKGFVNAVTRSQKQSYKPSGPNPATMGAIPTVPYQDFQFTPLGTPMPNAKPVIPHGEGILSQILDRHYRTSMRFSEVWKTFKDPAYH